MWLATAMWCRAAFVQNLTLSPCQDPTRIHYNMLCFFVPSWHVTLGVWLNPQFHQRSRLWWYFDWFQTYNRDRDTPTIWHTFCELINNKISKLTVQYHYCPIWSRHTLGDPQSYKSYDMEAIYKAPLVTGYHSTEEIKDIIMIYENKSKYR